MRLGFLMVMLLLPSIALAEGNCPPGHYPIGGPGVMGCAPISGGGAAPAAAPTPIGKWETR